jgi:hypothetical protein
MSGIVYRVYLNYPDPSTRENIYEVKYINQILYTIDTYLKAVQYCFLHRSNLKYGHNLYVIQYIEGRSLTKFRMNQYESNTF